MVLIGSLGLESVRYVSNDDNDDDIDDDETGSEGRRESETGEGVLSLLWSWPPPTPLLTITECR